MNRLEELLVILSGECAELQHVASRCIRHGMDGPYNTVDRCTYNQDQLETKMGDLLGVFKLVIMKAGLIEKNIMDAAETKARGVEDYLDFSSKRKDNSSTIPPAQPSEPKRTKRRARKQRKS